MGSMLCYAQLKEEDKGGEGGEGERERGGRSRGEGRNGCCGVGLVEQLPMLLLLYEPGETGDTVCLFYMNPIPCEIDMVGPRVWPFISHLRVRIIIQTSSCTLFLDLPLL
jgi:hypothetical protein